MSFGRLGLLGVKLGAMGVAGGGSAAPGTRIALFPNSTPENALVTDDVGTLLIAGNHTGTPVFTLEDDAGGLFTLVGNAIKVAAALDYETDTFHVIEVSVTGVTPAPALNPKSLVILVTDTLDIPAFATPPTMKFSIHTNSQLIAALDDF